MFFFLSFMLLFEIQFYCLALLFALFIPNTKLNHKKNVSNSTSKVLASISTQNFMFEFLSTSTKDASLRGKIAYFRTSIIFPKGRKISFLMKRLITSHNAPILSKQVTVLLCCKGERDFSKEALSSISR